MSAACVFAHPSKHFSSTAILSAMLGISLLLHEVVLTFPAF